MQYNWAVSGLLAGLVATHAISTLQARVGHKANPERITGYFSSMQSGFAFEIFFENRIRNGAGFKKFLRRKILVNEILLYSSNIFMKQHTISGWFMEISK